MGSQQRPLLKRRRGQNWAHDVTTPQKQESSKCLPQTESGTFICKLALEERHRVLPRGNQASKQQVPGRGRAKRVAPRCAFSDEQSKATPRPCRGDHTGLGGTCGVSGGQPRSILQLHVLHTLCCTLTAASGAAALRPLGRSGRRDPLAFAADAEWHRWGQKCNLPPPLVPDLAKYLTA